jgi:hypothetical protein
MMLMLKSSLVLGPLAVGASFATATGVGDVEPIIRYGVLGILAIILIWLGKLLKRFFDEHLDHVRRVTEAVEQQTRNSTLLVEELRRRPCMASSELLSDLAKPEDGGT